jgi:hypothetical protein
MEQPRSSQSHISPRFITSLLNPVCNQTDYFLDPNFKIILPPIPWSSYFILCLISFSLVGVKTWMFRHEAYIGKDLKVPSSGMWHKAAVNKSTNTSEKPTSCIHMVGGGDNNLGTGGSSEVLALIYQTAMHKTTEKQSHLGSLPLHNFLYSPVSSLFLMCSIIINLQR